MYIPAENEVRLPEKLEDIVILLQLRHDKVQIEGSGGDDVDDVDWSSDDVCAADWNDYRTLIHGPCDDVNGYPVIPRSL